MKYECTEEYSNIRNYEEFNEALISIENKLHDLNSKKFISDFVFESLKNNIKFLKNWASNYIYEITDTLDIPISYINFNSSGCFLEGIIQYNDIFKLINELTDDCYEFVNFKISPGTFKIKVNSVPYRLRK